MLTEEVEELLDAHVAIPIRIGQVDHGCRLLGGHLRIGSFQHQHQQLKHQHQQHHSAFHGLARLSDTGPCLAWHGTPRIREGRTAQGEAWMAWQETDGRKARDQRASTHRGAEDQAGLGQVADLDAACMCWWCVRVWCDE